MKIVFDIGANNGMSTLHLAKEGATVHAFEPVPEMCDEIIKNSKGIENYTLIQKAVSNFNGNAVFNVAGQRDWGCSSLNEFSDNLGETWPERDDFVITEKINVEVIRLDKFIEDNGITVIDYLHCDAQGSDLLVLDGLGKYISIVKEGVIEVSANKNLALYKGTDNTLLTAVAMLTDAGIRDIHITPWSQEYNIHFKR